MKKFGFLFLFICFANLLLAQNPKRKYLGIESIPNGVQVNVSDGVYIFRSFGPKIVETTFIPNGQKHVANSHAVSIVPDEDPFTWAMSSNYLIPPYVHIYRKKNGGFSPIIEIRTNPFQLSYSYNGKFLISEKWGYDVDSIGEKIQFNLQSSEKLLGTGNRVVGMNRRGYRLPLYNRAHYGYETHSEQMNYSLPLVISDKLYAVHFDNSYTGFLDLDSKKDSTLTFEMSGGRKTYQIIAGDTWYDLVNQYTTLTGKQPLPPIWAFGNFASRFGYHSESEARNVISQFREKKIPLDAIIFDLYWFGTTIQGTLGNFEFHRDSFPDPQKMIADFKKVGVKTILITEPFILTTSKTWEEAKTKKLLCTDVTGEKPFTYDFYFGNTGLLDIYKPETKIWFWNIYKNLINQGVEGLWGDLGEPEVHPDELYHSVGKANSVHNIYGHDWAKLVQEGYHNDFPNKRPFILMRSGYSGSQKFGIIPWTGDVNRTWGGLQSQIELSLQAGLQGLGYMHSDLGGFAGANDDPELYVRWLQYGVFQPVFRPHAQQEVASEAIFKDPTTKALAKSAIEWRYRLLPYNYTLAYENSRTGMPLMRPVFMEYEDRDDFLERNDVYMWGSEIYVCPVLNKGQKVQEIDFPDMHKPWFNLFTEEKVIPNYNVCVARCFWGTVMRTEYSESTKDTLSMDHIPVYVKAGAFIPMIENLQSTEDFKAENVEIHFYYDESVDSSSGTWFLDNGLDYQDFNKECYTLYSFHYKKLKHNKILISIDSDSPNCKAYSPNVDIVIHQVPELPKKIKVKDEKDINLSAIVLNETKKTISIPMSLINGNSLKMKF